MYLFIILRLGKSVIIVNLLFVFCGYCGGCSPGTALANDVVSAITTSGSLNLFSGHFSGGSK